MSSRRRLRRTLILSASVALVAGIGTIAAALMALVGSDVGCGLGGGTASAAGGPAPTKAALREIPPHWLAMYREAGSAIDISWPFLASIGYQECGHGTGDCYVVNPSGCAGPMEMAYVRGSACSPDPSVPTIWERFATDGDGDGRTDIFDPADSIFTAAKVLRADGAPPIGGSYGGYHEAACDYYGACGDSSADYADEVMARAVEYGFGDAEAEAEEGTDEPVTAGGAEESEAELAVLESTRPGRPATGRPGGDPRGGRKRSGTGTEGRQDRQTGTEPAAKRCEGSAVSPGSSAGSAAIVRIARSQLGTPETPPGSNCQKYGPCESWCALFVAWVWERAGVPLQGGPAERAYAGSFYDWVKEHGGRDLPPGATPSPGDAVMYGPEVANYGMEHVGIVEQVFPNGEITTIAGNFGDAVTRSGPFDPAEAVGSGGQPYEIYAYAEPPTTDPKRGGTDSAQGGAEAARPKAKKGGAGS